MSERNKDAHDQWVADHAGLAKWARCIPSLVVGGTKQGIPESELTKFHATMRSRLHGALI